MSKNNLLSGRDKELQELAEQYEAAQAENRSMYFDSGDLTDLANWYARKDKYDFATEVLEYGLKIHPNSLELKLEMIHQLIDLEKQDQANELLNELLAYDSIEVKKLKARLLLQEGKEKEADEIFDSIKRKNDISTIIEVAHIYIEMGSLDKAFEWLKPYIGKYEDDEEFLVVMASYYSSISDLDSAIDYCNKMIDKNPYSAPYWYTLATCYFAQDELEKTINACDYAIVGDEEFGDAHLLRGHAYLFLGNREAAIESYQKAEELEAAPSSYTNLMMAMDYIAHQEWEEGLSHLTAIIELESENLDSPAVLYAHAALCLFHLGKIRKAHQYCKRAYEIDPYDVFPRLVEARIYMEEGKHSSAKKTWKEALKIAPYAETWDEIAADCIELNQLEYAKNALEQICLLDEKFEYVHEKLAAISLILKDYESFSKHNALCAHPITVDRLEKLMDIIHTRDAKEVFDLIKNILIPDNNEK